MTLPKKGSRIISIGDFQYRWMASGNDGWIDLYVELDGGQGQGLAAKFDYHHEKYHFEKSIRLKQQFSLTPDIVKQTIELGKKLGWQPDEKGKALNLGHLDEKVTWKK